MAWKPLEPATNIPYTPKQRAAMIADAKRMAPGMTEEAINALIDIDLKAPCFKNLDYQVHVNKKQVGFREDGTTPVNQVWLSIRRIDRKPVRDWRDLQRIKTQLLGPDCEAVEIFPAEDRLVDTANQYHLWGYDDPTFRFPFGFFDGRVVDDKVDPATKAVQRKFA